MASGLKPLLSIRRWWRSMSPPALLVFSFVVLICIGTAGLMLIPGLQAGKHLSFIDALFTMTSAVCVTGLIVVDTATHFTFFGQLWILLHIQLGGLGLITLSTLVIAMLGRQLSLRSEMLAATPSGVRSTHDVGQLTLAVARATLMLEAAGAGLLWIVWAGDFGAIPALWHAVFHAVSAFCNAGFSTFSTNLAAFASKPLPLIIVSLLVILGGIGFLSGEEAWRWYRAGAARGPRRMSTHTWSALMTTALLLAGGTVLFAIFEWSHALSGMYPFDRIVNAWFMSAAARTAGFNAIGYSDVSNASAFLTILLMIVGGSPGSTAGGLKTTTFAVLVALAISRARGRRHVQLHGRAVPQGTVERTVSMTLLAAALMSASVFVLSWVEQPYESMTEQRGAFLPLLFEVVSAFCTVGLSMEQTAQLDPLGRLVIVAMMFIGRVGLLSFFAAISIRARTQIKDLRPAREDLIVG